MSNKANLLGLGLGLQIQMRFICSRCFAPVRRAKGMVLLTAYIKSFSEPSPWL